jgi:hypothetical protein
MTEQDVFYGDDGEPVGHLLAADDGNQVLVAFDGETVLAAATPDGEQLDPSGYTIDDGSDDVVSDPRIDQLYEWAQQQDQLREQQQIEPQQDEVGWWQEISDQKHDVEARLGRSLTLAESEAIAHHVTRQERRGETVDMAGALEDSWRTGAAQPLNLDDHSDRVSYMTENLQRSEREARGEDLSEPEPPSREFYDMNSREERQAWQIDRLEGRLDDDQAAAVAYDSTDVTE